jgi:hypothetical protein
MDGAFIFVPKRKFLLPGPACPGYTAVVHAICDPVSGLGLMSVLAVGFLLVTQLKHGGMQMWKVLGQTVVIPDNPEAVAMNQALVFLIKRAVIHPFHMNTRDGICHVVIRVKNLSHQTVGFGLRVSN